MENKTKNKKKIAIIVSACILAYCLFGTFVFFTNISMKKALDKEMEYLKFYQGKAEEYINSNTEISHKYGNSLSIEFDSTISYTPSEKKNFFVNMLNNFGYDAPETLEEFSAGVKEIYFEVKINGDDYKLTFEKNSNDKLFVSNLVEITE